MIKYKVIVENLTSKGGTGNQIREIITKKNQDIMELAVQYSNIMYDVNPEHFGWHRKSGEGTLEYIRRVWNDDYLFTIDNNAFSDMSFDRVMELNDLCKLSKECYYFSYTTGIKEKVSNNHQASELNNEIKNFTDVSLGFDLNATNRLKWQDIPREEGKVTFFDRIMTAVKQGIDPVFYSFSYYLNHQKFELPEQFEEQKNDVNWDSLKWDHKRWNEDNDTLIARVTQEFPRISKKFKRLSSEDTPWGSKNPQQFNWEDNPKLSKFEKGRWFYTNIENSNHLDYCGWPSVFFFKQLRVLFGVENRFHFSKNLIDRLYSLEF